MIEIYIFIRKKKQKPLKCIDIFLKKMYIVYLYYEVYETCFGTYARKRNKRKAGANRACKFSFFQLKQMFNPAMQVVLTVYWADKKKGAGYGKK